jgi:hypothetical protein
MGSKSDVGRRIQVSEARGGLIKFLDLGPGTGGGSSLPINRYFFCFCSLPWRQPQKRQEVRGWAKVDSRPLEAPEGGNPPGTSLAACPATTRNTMQGPRSNNSIGRRNEESPTRFEPDRASHSMSLLGHRGAERCLGSVGTKRRKDKPTEGRVKEEAPPRGRPLTAGMLLPSSSTWRSIPPATNAR